MCRFCEYTRYPITLSMIDDESALAPTASNTITKALHILLLLLLLLQVVVISEMMRKQPSTEALGCCL